MTNGSIFHSVNAPAGSGKTRALANYAVQLANNNHKVLISQPTIKLIQQTRSAIKHNDKQVEVTTVVSRAFQQSSVLSEVIQYIQNAKPGQGEILLISQDILAKLPAAQRKDWHLFVDEMPSGFEAFHMSIPDTHEFLTQHIKAHDVIVDDAASVEAVNNMGLRRLSNTKDDALVAYKPLVDALLDEDRLVCVNKGTFDELVRGEKTKGAISFFSILKPSFVEGFASVTVMGANMDESELYLLWDKLFNVSWKPHPTISKALSYTAHQNLGRLTIKYLIEGNWSKDFASKPYGDHAIFDEICRISEDELGDDFLWQANKDVPDHQFENGLRLPGKSHGLNKAAFMKTDAVTLLMAVNHQKAASDFLKLLGFSDEELKIVLQYQNEYQAMMRSSLRNAKSTADVTVIVVSKGSAEWLSKRFTNCVVEKLKNDLPEPNKLGRPAINAEPMTPAQKQKRYRENKKKREAEISRQLAASKSKTP